MPKLFNVREPHKHRSSKIDFLADKIEKEERPKISKNSHLHQSQEILPSQLLKSTQSSLVSVK